MEVDPRRSRNMAAIRSRDTAAELALRRELHRHGRRFFVNRRLLGDRRSVDLVFPRLHVAVFVDGCFWHACPQHSKLPRVNTGYWSPKLARNVERDRRTDADLRAAGWTVVRVWEHEGLGAAASRVEAALDAAIDQSPPHSERRARR